MRNRDCDGGCKLDRHFTCDTCIGSGVWPTNYQSGKIEVNGKMRKWTCFVKIVVVPEDATKTEGIWYGADGTAIGPDIRGQFAVIQEVFSDPSVGQYGILYKFPAGPGPGGLQ